MTVHARTRPLLAALLAALASACASGGGGGGGGYTADDALNGTIAYPFVDETKAIGRDQERDDKFIIKSAVGAREYTIEIPGAARDYDVQVPLADLGEGDPDVVAGRKPGALGSPLPTDKEMVNALPRLDKERPTDTALLDSAFGTGGAEGPKQAPSYTLGIAKVNEHFKRRQFEYALVELNQLLTFYPNSPQLHKMKGTVLVKMRNFKLAELAWIKALELEPRDKVVRSALERLQRRIVQSGQTPAGSLAADPIPKPVGTQEPLKEDALAH